MKEELQMDRNTEEKAMWNARNKTDVNNKTVMSQQQNGSWRSQIT